MDGAGGRERILKTPIPFAYAVHIKQMLVLYLGTLPFVLVPKMDFAAVLTVAGIAFGLMGIEEAGVEIENPFGCDANDLPLEEVARRWGRKVRGSPRRPGRHGGRRKTLRLMSAGQCFYIEAMNAEALRAMLSVRPFEPIEVELSSGQVLSVRHPENVIVLKNTLVVADPERTSSSGRLWSTSPPCALVNRPCLPLDSAGCLGSGERLDRFLTGGAALFLGGGSYPSSSSRSRASTL